MNIITNFKNIINTIIYDILLNILTIILEHTIKFIVCIINLILLIPRTIYHYYTIQSVLFIIFCLTSLAEIGAITTTSLYITKCNFEQNVNKDKIYNLIYLSLVFISFIMLKRVYFIMSNKSSNNDRCIAFLKIFMNIFIAIITHVFQIILLNRINISSDCSSNFITNDRNFCQIIIGSIVSIYELEFYYNYFSTIFNRNNNYSNSQIVPVEINNSNIIIIVNNDNNTNDLTNKINNIPNINYESIEYINNLCSICLEKNDNFIKLSNCDHYYHKECINKWILQDIKSSSLCPVCRSKL